MTVEEEDIFYDMHGQGELDFLNWTVTSKNLNMIFFKDTVQENTQGFFPMVL